MDLRAAVNLKPGARHREIGALKLGQPKHFAVEVHRLVDIGDRDRGVIERLDFYHGALRRAATGDG